MRPGMIVFGIIFLVLGALAYFNPSQTAQGTTTTVGTTGTDTRTSYTTYSIPWAVTYALLIIGGIVFILGLAIPEYTAPRDEEHYDSVTRERVAGKGGDRHVLHEKHVRKTH